MTSAHRRRRLQLLLATALLSTVLLSTVGGCQDNACTDRPAEAEIDVTLPPLEDLPDDAVATEVTLRIDDGEPLTRIFYTTLGFSFVFDFNGIDIPESLEIAARLLGDGGRVVAAGATDSSVRANGCNFFEVKVELPAGAVDGGGDLDRLPLDSGPAPDLSVVPDAAPDIGVDAAPDAGPDALSGPAEAGPDAPVLDA